MLDRIQTHRNERGFRIEARPDEHSSRVHKRPNVGRGVTCGLLNSGATVDLGLAIAAVRPRENVEWDDELVAALDGRQVPHRAGLVAGQPRGAGGGLQLGGLVLERAAQLLLDVELEVHAGGLRAEVVQEVGRERLLDALQPGAERVRVEALVLLLQAGERGRLHQPDHGRGDVVGRGDFLAGQLARLDVLQVLGGLLGGGELHAVFEDRRAADVRAGAGVLGAPGRLEAGVRGRGPGRGAGGALEVAGGAGPVAEGLGAHERGLVLLREHGAQGLDRGDAAELTGRGVAADVDDLVPREGAGAAVAAHEELGGAGPVVAGGLPDHRRDPHECVRGVRVGALHLDREVAVEDRDVLDEGLDERVPVLAGHGPADQLRERVVGHAAAVGVPGALEQVQAEGGDVAGQEVGDRADGPVGAPDRGVVRRVAGGDLQGAGHGGRRAREPAHLTVAHDERHASPPLRSWGTAGTRPACGR